MSAGRVRPRLDIRRALHEDAGQGLVEYVLIIAFASIVVITALALMGNTVKTAWYDSITSGLNRAGGS